MKNYIHAYNNSSASAKALRDTLDIKLLRRERSKVSSTKVNWVINWGNSKPHPTVVGKNYLNSYRSVSLVSNKKSFFEVCHGKDISIPDVSTDQGVAYTFCHNSGICVVREKLTGHSGEGIVLLTSDNFNDYDHSRAKLYVRYVKKKYEYRVHVFRGEVIDIRRKGLQEGFTREEVNWQIRNYDNGFRYLINMGHEPDPQVKEQAIKVVDLCDLDFGAVDIIYNEHERKAYVLEVNTAPGLEGSTLNNYVEAINRVINDL